MRGVDYEDVESLLQPQMRAQLPLPVLVRIYLDPLVLFKNANRGTIFNRRSALAYNKRLRWILVAYIQRWLCIATACLMAINPAAALASANPLFLLAAVGLGIGFTVGFVGVILIVACYFGLGMTEEF